jgi:hypothetical protein
VYTLVHDIPPIKSVAALGDSESPTQLTASCVTRDRGKHDTLSVESTGKPYQRAENPATSIFLDPIDGARDAFA